MTPGCEQAIQLCTQEALQALETVSEPLCCREETPMMQREHCWSTDKEVLGKSLPDCNSNPMNPFQKTLPTFYPINLFPNPLPTLSSPYKKVSLKWDVKVVWGIYNLPSSQITSHLNEESTKIQLLSLLIGSGSDRQHKHQFLQVHYYHWEKQYYKYGQFLPIVKMQFMYTTVSTENIELCFAGFWSRRQCR